MNYGKIYIHLRNLVEQRLAEKRDREISEEELAERDGVPVWEYRKVPGGEKKREESFKMLEGLEGVLVPA